MTAYERLFARLEGKPVDKVPNLNILMALVAKNAGVGYREYAQDYKKLVEGNLICAEKYGIDAVSVISDPMREASAFGATVIFPENDTPYSKPPLLEELDFSLIKTVTPFDDERTLDRIRAVEEFKTRVGNEYPIIGWVEGVLAEVADLRGVSNIMLDLAMEEPWIEEIFERVFSFQCQFAKAQIDAGADIIGIGNAVASLVGPAIYEKYAFEHDKNLVQFIHSHGAKSKLHICGNITPLMPYFKEIEPTILDLDWMVSIKDTIKALEGCNTSVCGNLDPVAVLMQGTPESIQKKVSECIDEGNNKSILAGGCEIPFNTPDENLEIMNKALYL